MWASTRDSLPAARLFLSGLIAMGIALAGCQGPPAGGAPLGVDELDTGRVLGVRFGMNGPALEAAMGTLELDQLATDLSDAPGARVYRETLDAAFNFKLVLVRYIVREGELASVELEYEAAVYKLLKEDLKKRWGWGIDQGIAGHRWRGGAVTAMLTPSMLGGRCRLTLNRRFTRQFKPQPLRE